MNEISTKLVDSLKTLGMTEYEAKVYSALVLFDRSEVKQIYEYLNMPKPSVYQSLKRLMDKGMVQVVSSKPSIYKAIPPKIALRHLSEVHRSAEENALEELERLEICPKDEESSDIIWTLFGENNVEHTLEELISKAQNSMKLILPDEYLDFLGLVENKDLKIDLLMFGSDSTLSKKYGLKNLVVHDAYEMDISNFGVIPSYIQELSLPSDQYSKFILIAIDNEEFMYIPPFPGVTQSGITSKNPYIIALSGILFKIIWQHTKEVPMD